MESIIPVIRYVESHFEKVQSNASPDAEMLNMLGGDGGSQVDLVFYLVHNSKSLLKPLANILLTLSCRAQAGRHQVPATIGVPDECYPACCQGR